MATRKRARPILYAIAAENHAMAPFSRNLRKSVGQRWGAAAAQRVLAGGEMSP